MPDGSPKRNPVEELADSFIERYRNGERPSLTEYTDRYPELADDIRDVFPALVAMEQIDQDLKQADPKPLTAVDEETPHLDHLGDYHIIREVGRGGMGIVYEAEQESLGRRVALKVLPKQMLLDPKQKKRFSREAKAAAKLHHTNIVPVFGVGEHEGLQYYAMQFIHGLGLDEVLTELKHMRPASGGCQPTDSATGEETLTNAYADREMERQRDGEKKTERHNLSAAFVAQSLLTGCFDRTVITDDSSLNSQPSTLDSHREGEAPAKPLTRDQWSEIRGQEEESIPRDSEELAPTLHYDINSSIDNRQSSIVT